MIIGVTGAQGFIGNHLGKYLAEKKYNVVAFGRDHNRKYSGVEWRIKDLNFCDEKDFAGVDKLIHLAGTAVDANALEKNFALTKKVLGAAIRAGVKYFYLVSSYAVYGDRQVPATVNDNINPIGEYAESKVLAENEVRQAILEQNIRGSVLRFCSAFGEGGKGLVSLLKDKIKNGEKVDINANFLRNYLHVKDICKAIDKIIEIENPEHTYNIEGEQCSSKELHEILLSMGINSKFQEKKTINYLSRGLKVGPSVTVKDFLTK